MRQLLLTIILLGVLLFFVPTRNNFAEEQAIEESLIGDLQQAQTLEEFERATVEIQEKRSELITSLIRILRNETDKEKKIRICYLLGEYRATEAIWDLSKNISLEAQIPDELTEKPLWLKYPAQEALVKCGNRSIRYMLENIESSDNELIQKLSIEVIWQVMGEGLTQVLDGKNYARMIIEKRIDEETDSVKKARLQSSLKYLGRTEGIN